MSRHTTFRFCLDPTVEQHEVLARNAGASRFAFNQCLRMVKTALTQHKTDPTIDVPWTEFDLINAFNAWKKTEAAGRVFTVDTTGDAEIVVTGLPWRTEVCQQVFEEAAVDCGRALAAWSDSRCGKRKGKRVGFPRFKKKTQAVASFRLRNKHPKGRPSAIRVGIDRGLSAFLVAAHADGEELVRITAAPKALSAGMTRQRRLAKSLSRKKIGSRNRRDAAAKLGRHHHHIANVRRHFLHQVSNELVKTHDRLVLENLNVTGMLANHRLARAISDAGWAEFARLLGYKHAWRGGTIMVADRWYPSSRLCPQCGDIRGDLTLADRVFTCGCGHSADRDCNAAVNLARWAEKHHLDPRTPKRGGRATNARRRDGADQHPSCAGETSPDDAGTDVHAAPAA